MLHAYPGPIYSLTFRHWSYGTLYNYIIVSRMMPRPLIIIQFSTCKAINPICPVIPRSKSIIITPTVTTSRLAIPRWCNGTSWNFFNLSFQLSTTSSHNLLATLLSEVLNANTLLLTTFFISPIVACAACVTPTPILVLPSFQRWRNPELHRPMHMRRLGTKGDWDFRILIWSKTLMELIFHPCSEFRWRPEGPVSLIHSPHFFVGAPGIFSDVLRFVQMLKKEWSAESNGKLPHLFIPSKTAT